MNTYYLLYVIGRLVDALNSETQSAKSIDALQLGAQTLARAKHEHEVRQSELRAAIHEGAL